MAIVFKGILYFHVCSSSSISSPNSERKRNELFHINFVIKQIQVDTLFDTSSQINLISEAVVKKLKLKTPHHKPYPLRWVCDNDQLQVTKQCRLRFFITSKFFDEVELDVVLLDICGIVLGIPCIIG